MHINGRNIVTRVGLQLARNVIGFCPQTNPIIGILTVTEASSDFLIATRACALPQRISIYCAIFQRLCS